MNTCSFCKEPAVLHSGRHYCKGHLGLYDGPAIQDMIPSQNNELIRAFLLDVFNTDQPTFGMFPILRQRFPGVERGRWIGSQKGFSKSQELYIGECYIQWLSGNAMALKGGEKWLNGTDEILERPLGWL